jgi:2-keto-4-pentenoate hydratase/2-oxohepta-3-ene-1,7-dioic acid hydratase in catechol pathway
MTLNVGDVICTGTPARARIGSKAPKFLSPGDTVEVTINQIGTIGNTFN